MKDKNSNFIFTKYQTIGAPDAETDTILDDAFIDTGALNVLLDTTSPRCIIVGRTGSGKSALIKKILKSHNKVIRIAPEAMSLKFLTNSTILDYFRGINIKLNFFYKVLWKHVFIVEILKLYLGENTIKKQTFIDSVFSKISTGGKGDKARKSALTYFDKWSEEFWLKSEHRIQSLEQELEKKFFDETGIDIKMAKKNVKSESINSEKHILEVKHKAEQVINETQAEELINLIDILSENVFDGHQKKYYIVIDDLDKDWVSPQIVYDLIGAMIEIIKEFQGKFKGIKIIISLRDNIHQIVFSGKEHRGGQREKFAPMFLSLTWDESQLTELINKRLLLLSKNELGTDNIFIKNEKQAINEINYILERTYMRPRDVISFFNKMIECSNNKSYFTKSLIKIAESPYSVERMQALEDEWAENYGDINKICYFMIGINNGFNMFSIKEDSFAHVLLDSEYKYNFKGELQNAVGKWKDSKYKPNDFKDFLTVVLFILYRIGIIGIKKRPELEVEFFFSASSILQPSDFDKHSRFYVHKALYSALKINTREQEIDSFD